MLRRLPIFDSVGPKSTNQSLKIARAIASSVSSMEVKTSIVRDEAAARLKRASSLVGDAHEPKKVLVIDVGGTSVKLLASGDEHFQPGHLRAPLRHPDLPPCWRLGYQ
jgi:hypothetical protein